MALVTSRIRYDVGGGNAWRRFSEAVRAAALHERVRSVCEPGGGARPLLDPDFVSAKGLEYVVLDISQAELDKAPASHTKVRADLMSPDLGGLGTYDLVFSQTLAEHLVDPVVFHRNVLRILRPGGRALHFFPTLYEPTMVLNRLLPESVTQQLLLWLQPRRQRGGKEEKFHAYYRWCPGPTARQHRRLESVGFEVEEYVGFFGHDYLFDLSLLHRAQFTLARALVRHPIPALTSAAYVVLRKPGATTRS